jgi:hypothetical protein
MTAQTVAPRTTGKLVSLTPQREQKMRLYDAIISTGADLWALVAKAKPIFSAINGHDRACDRAVEQIDAIAIRICLDAEIFNDDVSFRRGAAIRAKCATYRAADRHEDAGVVLVQTILARIVGLVAGLNKRLTAELVKRGSRKGGAS